MMYTVWRERERRERAEKSAIHDIKSAGATVYFTYMARGIIFCKDNIRCIEKWEGSRQKLFYWLR